MRFAPWRYRLCGSGIPILARAWRITTPSRVRDEVSLDEVERIVI
jgi:hypothetical protein